MEEAEEPAGRELGVLADLLICYGQPLTDEVKPGESQMKGDASS